MARAMAVSLGSASRSTGVVVVARSRRQRRDDVAVTITEGKDLAALEMCPLRPRFSPPLFFRSRRAVAVDD